MSQWWQLLRPKTLLASIGPILLATALAHQHVTIEVSLFLATLSCAMLLQISVNFANDLFDHLSGVDGTDRLGPKRALQTGHISIAQLKHALTLTTLSAMLIGSYLIYLGGVYFLFLGAVSLLGVFAYSSGPYPLASNALGEVTVFVFFGLVAVLGTFYLHTGFLTPSAILYAAAVGLLSAALMLVNNIRDIATDAKAGKFTLAVKLGDHKARNSYKCLLISSLIIHLAASIGNGYSMLFPALICLILLPALFVQIQQLQGTELNQLLANTAKYGFVYALSTTVVFILI